MALHRKLDALKSLKPDVAVVCECAEPERLRKRTVYWGMAADPVWIGKNPNKGLAVLTFNDYHATLADVYRPSLNFIAPVHIDGPNVFNLLAVWAQNASAGVLRKSQFGPLRLALRRYYRDFLSTGSAVVAGDLNNNAIWDRPGWRINHAYAVQALDEYNLVSAYHETRREQQGAESMPTHYWRDRKKDGPTYHLDYIFLPRTWVPKIREMQVGSFEEWCGNGLSDHVPVMVEVVF